MDFEKQAGRVLRSIRSRLDLGLWPVSVIRDDRLAVVAAEDRVYGVRPGYSIPWSDSLCSRMLKGDGPPIAPVVEKVPAYAGAPMRATRAIGAYAGIPVYGGDSRVNAVLEGFDPSPQPASITSELPLLETFADVLGVAFEGEEATDDAAPGRVVNRPLLADPVIGLANGLGWQGFLRAEHARQASRRHPSVEVLVELLEAETGDRDSAAPVGDALLHTVADVLARCLGTTGLVARLDDLRFAALLVDDTGDCGDAVIRCIEDNLAEAGVTAQVAASFFRDSEPPGDPNRRRDRRRASLGLTAAQGERFAPRTVARWERLGRPLRFIRLNDHE